MKVVLFCGGLGMRIREYSDDVPKPMVPIGYRPILWHVMKYYAHYGHRDFILCLGYKANVVKEYFLNYNECISNDFTMTHGGEGIVLAHSDIQDWKITFVDTGMTTNVGGRLRKVREYLRGEKVFMANYADNLTDAPLPSMIEHFEKGGKIASFLCVRPSQSFHLVTMNEKHVVSGINSVAKSDVWINGGYFIFNESIFDHMHEGEELVEEPFQRLIDKEELTAYRHDGFFMCMDTFKEREILDDLYTHGKAPWGVWSSYKGGPAR